VFAVWVDRAIDRIVALLALIACLSLVVGLLDVEVHPPPQLAESATVATSRLHDSRLTVIVREACKAAAECPPLPDAHVRVFWHQDARYFMVAEGRTAHDGRVRLDDLPRGVAWVLAEANGRARRSARVRLAAGEQAVALNLPSAAALGVTVLDEAGAGVVRATVLVEGDDPLPHGLLTDVAGRARFARLGPGPWVVKVSAPGFETVTRQGVREDVTVNLRNLGGLQVSVLDVDGRPAGGATVLIVGSRLWPARRAETDHEGRARVGGLLAGTYDLRATRGNEVSDTLFGLHLERSGQQQVTLRLRAGRSVTALVTDGSDDQAAVVPGADVVLVEGGLSPFPLQGRTGADGTITLGPIGPGPATLAAGAVGFVSRSAVPVPTEGEGANDPVRIPLLRGAKLVGEVVDGDDHPVDGASVEVVGTDLYGMPVSETPSLLNFRSTHFSWALAGPAPLIPAGELGVMPGPVPPIPQVWRGDSVSAAVPTDLLPASAVSPWVTAWDGSFEAAPVTPGRLRVIVRHPEFVEAASDAVMLAPGGTARVKVVLHVGGALEGRVVDSRGFPVEGARVDATAVSGSLERTALTDRHGEFAFAALPLEVRLGLARPDELDRIVLQQTITVPEKQTTQVELEMPDPREPVTVLVQDESDAAVPTAQVTILSLDPRVPLRQTFFTDEGGRAEFEQARGLPLRIVVEAPGSPHEERQLEAAPEDVVVHLRSGVIVEGVVTSVRGRRYVEGATVTLVSGGTRQVAFTDREGAYRFANVPAGAARVVVSHSAYATREVAVRVERTGRNDRPYELDSIDLAEPGIIEGEVLDVEGHPVMGARVGVGMVPAYLPVGALPEGMTVTDMQGRFKLTGVAPGAVDVEAYAVEAGRGIRRGIQVTEGRTTEDVTIRLHAEEGVEDPPTSGNLAVTLGERGQRPVRVVIVHVAAGSEAERAGLVPGDVVLAVDGVEPVSMLDARARFSGRAGTDVVLEIERGGAKRTLRVGRERVRR
jgi:membrane-associated protease RseP (regulator of RpoE activity)